MGGGGLDQGSDPRAGVTDTARIWDRHRHASDVHQHGEGDGGRCAQSTVQTCQRSSKELTERNDRLQRNLASKTSWLSGEVRSMLCRMNLTHPSPRSDPPRGEEYWIPTDPRFKHAVDLVSYIRSSPEFSDTFSIGVAGHFAVFSASVCF